MCNQFGNKRKTFDTCIDKSTTIQLSQKNQNVAKETTQKGQSKEEGGSEFLDKFVESSKSQK